VGIPTATKSRHSGISFFEIRGKARSASLPTNLMARKIRTEIDDTELQKIFTHPEGDIVAACGFPRP
jgi:hypothetical protein